MRVEFEAPFQIDDTVWFMCSQQKWLRCPDCIGEPIRDIDGHKFECVYCKGGGEVLTTEDNIISGTVQQITVTKKSVASDYIISPIKVRLVYIDNKYFVSKDFPIDLLYLTKEECHAKESQVK